MAGAFVGGEVLNWSLGVGWVDLDIDVVLALGAVDGSALLRLACCRGCAVTFGVAAGA